MKNKKVSIIALCIIYVILFAGVGILVFKPGINNLKQANKVVIYSEEEMAKKVIEIEKEGKAKKDSIANMYAPMKEEIAKEYKTKEDEINSKYDKLEKEIEAKYAAERKKLNAEKNDLSVKVNKEFFAHGFSNKYYTLHDQEMEATEKVSSLDSKKDEEIRNNSTNKTKQINELKRAKDASVKEIDAKYNREIQLVSNEVNEQINVVKNAKQVKDSYIKEFIKYLVGGIFILLLPVIYITIVYNDLIRKLNVVKEKWSQVDVYLKQRMDLIPNIVNSVKGYTKHEKDTFKNIADARSKAMNAETKEDEINANKLIDQGINKILLLKEAYPELKADQNFIDLQDNLKEIEGNIAFSRQIYNKAVLNYKNKTEMFPSNIIAGLFNFKEELFFEIDDEDKESVNVKF